MTRDSVLLGKRLDLVSRSDVPPRCSIVDDAMCLAWVQWVGGTQATAVGEANGRPWEFHTTGRRILHIQGLHADSHSVVLGFSGRPTSGEARLWTGETYRLRTDWRGKTRFDDETRRAVLVLTHPWFGAGATSAQLSRVPVHGNAHLPLTLLTAYLNLLLGMRPVSRMGTLFGRIPKTVLPQPGN